MNAPTLLDVYTAATKRIRALCMIHPLQSFPRSRAVADLASRMLAEPEGDIDAIARTVFMAHAEAQIGRLEDLAGKAVKR